MRLPGAAPFGLTAKVAKVAAATEVESSGDTSASHRESRRKEKKGKKNKKVALGGNKEEVAAVKPQPVVQTIELAGGQPASPPAPLYPATGATSGTAKCGRRKRNSDVR